MGKDTGKVALSVTMASLIATSAAGHIGSSCTEALSLSVPNVTVVAIDYRTRGEVIPLPNTVQSCGGPDFKANATNDFCRIVVNVSTSDSSSVRLEGWLPDKWNGRFLAAGTGGEGGCIDYQQVQNGAQLGFASFGTNAGHDGETGFDFFLGQPEVINDFGHRALHVEAEVGKQIIAQYYGRPANKNYYQGCSTGGRQGLQNAQLYPGDFDGIVVGAPAIDWLHIVASKGILARRIGWPDINSTAYVRPEQWPAIVAKQIELFDPLDGVSDGVIDDPTKYNFDPAILTCGTGLLNSSLCLTPHQVASVRAAYQPLASSEGRIVYPSFDIGANTDVFSNNQKDGAPQLAYTVLQDFWRGAVYNDSTWTPHNFTVADMDFAIKVNPGGVNAAGADFGEFYAKGGKILSFHGRADQTVTSKLSMEYYSRAQEALDVSVEDMHSFYRLFFIPGMRHCSGGLGAYHLGESYPLDKHKVNPREHLLLALVDWVEKGNAPPSLVGSSYAGDDVTQPVIAQRTHCYYPYESKWDGVGNTLLAESWRCVLPGGDA